MIDFLNRLKEFMEGLSFTPSIVEIGLYNENGNSVAIRPSPSNIDDREVEGGKFYNYSFQVLVHHQDNMTAHKTINYLTNELDGLPNGAITSSNSSFSLVSFKCTTTPNYVQKTSYGTLWTAIFNAELYIMGGK